MKKEIIYIGLGKMGQNMVLRLKEKGWGIYAYDIDEKNRNFVKEKGINVFDSLNSLFLAYKNNPKLIWFMVPHTVVDEVLNEILDFLTDADVVVDGGNSNYEKSIKRAKELAKRNINFIDAGISGGPYGARNGACVMIGGEKNIFENYEELFSDISYDSRAYAYLGKSGAGHFAKMVHNGIEYGMMQAIAEGFTVLKKSEFNFDLHKVAWLYNQRSVIESRLIGWLESAFERYGEDLKEISGSVAASGEGRWTVETAKKMGLNVPVIEDSLLFREESQKKPSYTGRILSALRNQFGGHDVFKR